MGKRRGLGGWDARNPVDRQVFGPNEIEVGVQTPPTPRGIAEKEVSRTSCRSQGRGSMNQGAVFLDVCVFI